MRPESLDFLKAIVNVPSPSGYEERAAEIYREYTGKFADKVWTDVHGNAYAALNPSTYGQCYNATRDRNFTWRDFYREAAEAMVMRSSRWVNSSVP